MPEPLKTLHVTTVDVTAHCFLRSWMETLIRSGAEVSLATTVQNFRDSLEATGAEVLDLPISRRVEPLSDLASLLDMVYLIRRLRPDIVHTHTAKAGFIGRLAAWLNGVPLVIHTIHEMPNNSTDKPMLKLMYWALEWLAARWCHHLVTVSHANERQILREAICRRDKLTVVRGGISLANYRPRRTRDEVRRQLGIPLEAPLVGTVGRLEPAKGYPVLFDAFERVLESRPDCHLVFAGVGHLKDDLLVEAARPGLRGQVHYAGYFDAVPDLMNCLDVFVLASLQEGLGVVLLEAMALSRPVVSTRVGGTADVVVDRQTGRLVPPRDAGALAEAMLFCLEHPEEAERMGAAGRKRVETDFEDAETNRRLFNLYRNLWERFRPRAAAAGE
ncbi:MAG: glycosyltransferase family 4 protein [Candidatus Eremiobacterota bacterium]